MMPSLQLISRNVFFFDLAADLGEKKTWLSYIYFFSLEEGQEDKANLDKKETPGKYLIWTIRVRDQLAGAVLNSDSVFG